MYLDLLRLLSLWKFQGENPSGRQVTFNSSNVALVTI